jgi:hypothetical protein
MLKSRSMRPKCSRHEPVHADRRLSHASVIVAASGARAPYRGDRKHACRELVGIELRILCSGRLDTTEWLKLKQDVREILNGQLDSTARNHEVRGPWTILLNNIAPTFHLLSGTQTSSVVFISAQTHQNEQDTFIEDLRKGCSNLVKHTRNHPDSACPVLFVRLCANASLSNCAERANDYFNQLPSERVGLILLYQAAVVTSEIETSIAHYIVPILGPQFEIWTRPPGKPVRQLPNLAVLIGVTLGAASRKVIRTEAGEIPLDGSYTYQRGDIYKFYRCEGKEVQVQLSNPAPQINIHAEIGDDSGSRPSRAITRFDCCLGSRPAEAASNCPQRRRNRFCGTSLPNDVAMMIAHIST